MELAIVAAVLVCCFVYVLLKVNRLEQRVNESFERIERQLEETKEKYDQAAEAARIAEEERLNSERKFQEGLDSIINYSSQGVKNDGQS